MGLVNSDNYCPFRDIEKCFMSIYTATMTNIRLNLDSKPTGNKKIQDPYLSYGA